MSKTPIDPSEPSKSSDAIAREAPSLPDLYAALTDAATKKDIESFERLARQAQEESDAKRAKHERRDPPPSKNLAVQKTSSPNQRHARPAPVAKDEWPSDWGNEYRGMPNDLIRTALFNIRRSAKRQMMDNVKIAAMGTATMFYSGEELRIKEEDVLMTIFQFQRKFKIGQPWSVNGRDFLTMMQWTDGRRGYIELYASLMRLSKGHLSIVRPDDGVDKFVIEAGALLSHLKIDHNGPAGTTEITIAVNPETQALWESRGYTKVNWEQRLKLSSPLARYLHRFYSSHHTPHPMSVTYLHGLTGSTVESMAKFRQMLKDALDSLVGINFLALYTINSSDNVNVKRVHAISNT